MTTTTETTAAPTAPTAMDECRDLRGEYTTGERFYSVRERPCDYQSVREWYFEAGVAICRVVERCAWPSCEA